MKCRRRMVAWGWCFGLGLAFGWFRTFRGKYVEFQFSKSGGGLRPTRVLRGWYAPFGLSVVVWTMGIDICFLCGLAWLVLNL